VAGNALAMPDDTQARAALADPSFDPSSTALIAEAALAPQPPGVSASHPATITSYSPEQVVLTADGPGQLVLTDAFYPGWTATIDGAPATIERADIMFRGLSLSRGQHQIEFHYRPRSVWVGLLTSGLAWGAL